MVLGRSARAVLVLTLLAQAAVAQSNEKAERTAARALGTAGVEAYQEGDYPAASDKLDKAFALLKVPSLGLWSARAMVKRGLWIEALDRYLEAASIQIPAGEVAVQQNAQKDARREAEELKARLPQLLIELKGASADEVSLTIDAQPVASSVIGQPRLVNPGAHQVDATLGARHASGEATCTERQPCSVTLELAAEVKPATKPASTVLSAPSPADADKPRSWQPTLGWVALGAGVVGVGIGAFTGLKAISARKDLDDSHQCVGERCPPALKDTVDNLMTYRTVSTVGFVAGGVLAAAGVTLLLTAPSHHSETALYLAPGSVELRGSF